MKSFKYWFCDLILLTVIGAIEVKLMNNIGYFVQIIERQLLGCKMFALTDTKLAKRGSFWCFVTWVTSWTTETSCKLWCLIWRTSKSIFLPSRNIQSFPKNEYNSNFLWKLNQNNLTCKKFVHNTFQFTQISINSSTECLNQMQILLNYS